MSHLCTILIDQSDIVKVIVFFEPSQCSFQTAQTGTGTTVHTYLEYLEICSSYSDFANILQFSYLVNLMILVKMAILVSLVILAIMVNLTFPLNPVNLVYLMILKNLVILMLFRFWRTW